jgi:hypothetical protein
MDLITAIFTKEEAMVISKIPITAICKKMYKFGRVLMQENFLLGVHIDHLAKDRQEVSKAESSQQTNGRDIWQLIWQLKIHNAKKMFLCRACHNLLPTKKNLRK